MREAKRRMSGQRWRRATAVASLAVLLHLGLMTGSGHASALEAPVADAAQIRSAGGPHHHVATGASTHGTTGADRRTGAHGDRHHSASASTSAEAGKDHHPSAATSTGKELTGHPSLPDGRPHSVCGVVVAVVRIGATAPVALDSKAVAPATDLGETSGAVPNLSAGSPPLAPPGERRALLQLYRI